MKIPDNIFLDPDNDDLTYQFKLDGDNDLPYWVRFDKDELEAVFTPINTTL